MKKSANLTPYIRGLLAPELNEIWPAESGSTLRHKYKFDGGCRGVRSVSISNNSKYLIITYEENTPRIRILDLQKLEFVPIDYEGHTASVRLTNITSDNKAIHTASWDGSSRRFEIETGKCTLILSGFGRSPSCYLDPDQKYLFTASYDSDCDIESKNTGRCWDLSTGRLKAVYKHMNGRLAPEAIDIVYNQGRVFTGSDDGNLYLWNLEGGEPLKEYFSFEGSVRKLAVSANFIAAACTDGLVRVHHKSSGNPYKYLSHAEKDVRTVLISGDETRIWSATDKGIVYCYNLTDGQMIYRRKINALWIWSMALMQNEQILVTGSGDGCVAFISAISGKILARLHNLIKSNDILITCPPDKAFPQGFFYTSNKDLIQVIVHEKASDTPRELHPDDPKCKAYIKKMQLKNLIIAKLKNTGYYGALTRNHLHNINLPGTPDIARMSRSLKA